MEGVHATTSQTVPLPDPVGTEGDSFVATVKAHYQGLARLAYVLCGDPHQAEDAVAEAFARVWPRWRDREIDNLGAYLRRAVINQVHGGLRRRVIEARHERHQSGVPPDWSLDGQVSDRDLVWRALLQLPAGQRAVIALRYYEDRSEDETATLLGVPVGTVKSRAARGLARLQQLLREGADGA
jgi:RNA polymerase sigma-70 factor (sigma-E family)